MIDTPQSRSFHLAGRFLLLLLAVEVLLWRSETVGSRQL